MTDVPDPDPTGGGPLADLPGAADRPIDDPSLADRANPRWDDDDPATPEPELEAQPLANRDGSSNVMPPKAMPDDPGALLEGPDEGGTPQDQAARPLTPDGAGRDNIREGLGGGAANPALAEGGDSG